MTFEKFEKIIMFNRMHQEQVCGMTGDFYETAGLGCENVIPDLLQIVRLVLKDCHTILIEIPMKDSEIGAVYYKGDAYNYLVLNSALPKVNVRFALSHEIYHILYQEKRQVRKMQLYAGNAEPGDEEEMAANLFAGILLMPEQNFRKMYERFRRENGKQDTELTVLARLMNYYQVPYMAAFIRCCELGLFGNGAVLEQLLYVNGDEVRNEFSRLWLNEELLCASGQDDFPRLEQLVRLKGIQFQTAGILRKSTLSAAMKNMRTIYQEIRR